jgi:hypothetical protein
METKLPIPRRDTMRLRIALLLSLATSTAFAVDMPARKPGLWELKMVFEGGPTAVPAQTFQHCIDAATDKQMNTVGGGMRADQCSKQDIKQSGNTLTIDSVCNFGAGNQTSRAVVTGDFNSAYTVKVNSKRDGPALPGMAAETNMTMESKWLGPCKADQKPGDIVMSNGMKMNINDMAKGGVPPGMKK